MSKITIRKLFKFLEYTVKRKQFPLEKLKRKETANISLNSETFEDPLDKSNKEAARIKDEKVHPGPSNLYY